MVTTALLRILQKVAKDTKERTLLPPTHSVLRRTSRAPRYGGQAGGAPAPELRSSARCWAKPPGSNVGALNPVPAIPLGVRWAPPAAVVEALRPSRPSVIGFRF